MNTVARIDLYQGLWGRVHAKLYDEDGNQVDEFYGPGDGIMDEVKRDYSIDEHTTINKR